MVLTSELQVRTEVVLSSHYAQWKNGQNRNFHPYCDPDCDPEQRRGVGVATLMLITVLSVAGCADRPQVQPTDGHEPCVIPRGGFDCGDKVKQEDNFMRFEQPGHQLP